ncbi:SdpI family protein [Domibacillus sp. A3M-37]|uniref:SdpI family protein n=1 Tax=Domibacillus TaxID=1433999 RepID=UPI0020B87B32|nr:SdpI family protein [Domibacillus sp. A3M-37]MCP3762153.1 SdpI family protein [Domibacillus sp. A3M-37]
MKEYRYFWLVISAAFLISFIILPYLPDQIATHWGPAGEVDGYSSKWFGAFFGPLMLLFVGVLLIASPKIDPRRQNYGKFKSSYLIIMNASVTLLFIIHLLTLVNGLGYAVQMDVAVSLLIGSLFIVIGNYMPRVRPSYLVGIRTPWTLADDQVWTKTHRTGGLLFVIGGLVLIVAAFLPVAVKITALVVVIILISLIPFIQSYLLFKKMHR